MNTFLQMLRIAFWMVPLQRALTVIGAAVLVAAQLFRLPFNMPGSTLPLTFMGAALMMIVPLLAGGVFLRMLVASRALLLRPHARGRLLAGAFGILLLASLLWLFCYWMAFRPVPVTLQPDPEHYLLMFGMTMSLGTQCAFALFIASRSPFSTLLILLIWQAPGLLLHAFGVEDASRLLGGPVSVAMSLLLWVVFGIWFLRVRRIHLGAWKRAQKDESPAAESIAPPASREQAMSRWILANGTPLKLGLQCLLAALGMLAIQWMFGREAGTRPLQAMMLGALSVMTVVTGTLGSSMAARSRALWLSAGRSRMQLHGWVERQMLRVMLSVFVAVLPAAALVWWGLRPAPALPAGYGLAALLAPGLCAGWLGLMQQHRRSLLDVLAALAIAAGLFYGLLRPLYVGSADARWDILGAELALAVLLREVAWVRWRGADWRRAPRAS